MPGSCGKEILGRGVMHVNVMLVGEEEFELAKGVGGAGWLLHTIGRVEAVGIPIY